MNDASLKSSFPSEDDVTTFLNKDSNNSSNGKAEKITQAGLVAEIDRLKNEAEKAKERKGMLIVKPFDQWISEAKERPIPQMLFDEFWFENELCFLFADTGAGKTILAVQIADAIANGNGMTILRIEAKKQIVLYLDFELSDKQIEGRYSDNYTNHYRFNGNLYRSEIAPDMELPEGLTFEEYLYNSLEISLKETGAKIIIVDNVTYLKDEMERAKNALPLMKLLKALKKKYDLSILCLAHTPKRDLAKPLTRNDLAGSKTLMNFCDSAFAIGESAKDSYIRYIKQIKVRQKPFKYDADNVCTCQIIQPDNFLKFDFTGFGLENDHLKVINEKDRQAMREKVLELQSKGMSFRDIGKELNISHMKAKRLTE